MKLKQTSKTIGMYLLRSSLIKHIIYAFLFVYIAGMINYNVAKIYGDMSLQLRYIGSINEEVFRLFSLMMGSPLAYLYTLILSVSEFYSYIIHVTNTYGCVPRKFIDIRMIIIIVHFTCLLIQWCGYKLYQKKNKKIYIFLSFLVAALFHLLWNNFLNVHIWNML